MVPTGSLVAVVAAIYLGATALWLLFAWLTGRAIAGKKGRRRWLLTLALALAPLLVPVAEMAQARLGQRSERLAMQRRSHEAEGYFRAACAARPALPASRAVVDGSGGVDIIAAGGSYVAGYHVGELGLLQYATPLRWTADVTDLEPAVRAGFAFVENSDASGRLVRTGQARYELRLEDISTHEDRDHWVGRGRMRLVDRRDGHVVAEYIGLSVNARPGLESMDDSASGWPTTRECGTAEQRYASSISMWPALAFFFGEIVKVQ